jgi:large subunit ribosomal protein L35
MTRFVKKTPKLGVPASGCSGGSQRRPISMPKQKTHKGLKKRFRLTANGKIKHRCAGTSHLASRKTQKRKRNLRGTTVLINQAETRTISKLLGKYSS